MTPASSRVEPIPAKLETPDEKAQTLVALHQVPSLHGIRETEDGLTIGPMTTLSEIAASEEILSRYPALSAATQTIGTSTIQEMGTIGGNIMLDTRCKYLNQPTGWRKTIGGCLKCDGNVCHVARTSHIATQPTVQTRFPFCG